MYGGDGSKFVPSHHLTSVCGTIGSLRNDDDGNENGKKKIGLDKQNNNFARASRFFVHFSAVVARLQRETASFLVLSRTGTNGQQLFLNFDAVL